MRIAIVNDLDIAVVALQSILAGDGRHELAWVARDGAEAVARAAEDTPDLILMDLLMPVMDGAEATRRIMRASPCAILVVTATVDGNSGKVFEAMGYGALDAVDTPTYRAGAPQGAAALLDKIRTVERLLRTSAGPVGTPPPVPASGRGREATPLVAIGASTGGPKALAAVLSGLPATGSFAVVVVQHVDPRFVAGLAEWLSSSSSLEVRAAAVGDTPEPGKVLIAATEHHLRLLPGGELAYSEEPEELVYRPSVDVFFHDLALHWPVPRVAVLLTGMGRDGAEGMLALRRGGWHTIAQDEETSVIYGMPRAAAEAGAAVEVLPVERIGPAVAAALERARASKAAT